MDTVVSAFGSALTYVTTNMSMLEIVATVFGLLCVYLTVKEHMWCWPTGIIMAMLYAVVFYEVKLYSDVGLQIFYVIVQFYGWYNWKYGGKEKDKLPIRTLRTSHRIAWGALCLIGAGMLGYVMHTYTDASYPYLDALITVASVIAQFFLTYKIWESWVLWISVDIIAINVYGLKQLYLTSGLYAIFLVLATMGLLEWNRNYKRQKAHAA